MREDKPVFYGGIEAGGTKFVCAVGSTPDNIASVARIPTTSPQETLRRAAEFFHSEALKKTIRAIGIGSFGPLDLNPESPTFGQITTTPKKGWAFTDITSSLRNALGLPVYFDTDVNAAALAENKWGAAAGLDTFIYITVGTGIGGGGMIDGRLMHGLMHPEMGHLLIPHDRVKDPFPGCCPFHEDCLEGLASGTAVAKRWGAAPESLPPDHQAWELEATYLSEGICNLILSISPGRIVLGGGIMKTPGLIEKVRGGTLRQLNNYVNSPAIRDKIGEFIVPPDLGDLSGVLGAIAIAQSGVTSQIVQ